MHGALYTIWGSRGFAVRGFALKNGAVFGILSNLLTVFGILSNLPTAFGFENPDGLGFRCIFSAVFGITPPISTVFGIQNKRGSRFSIISARSLFFHKCCCKFIFCFIPCYALYLISPVYTSSNFQQNQPSSICLLTFN